MSARYSAENTTKKQENTADKGFKPYFYTLKGKFMIQTILILYALNAAFPVPSWIFVVSWILFALNTVSVFYTEYNKKSRP